MGRARRLSPGTSIGSQRETPPEVSSARRAPHQAMPRDRNAQGVLRRFIRWRRGRRRPASGTPTRRDCRLHRLHQDRAFGYRHAPDLAVRLREPADARDRSIGSRRVSSPTLRPRRHLCAPTASILGPLGQRPHHPAELVCAWSWAANTSRESRRRLSMSLSAASCRPARRRGLPMLVTRSSRRLLARRTTFAPGYRAGA